jgi:hypothetical protein
MCVYVYIYVGSRQRGIYTYSDSLRAGRFGVRNSEGRGRFSVPVQRGPATHLASSTLGTGSSRGVKRPGRGVEHTPPSNIKLCVEMGVLYSN